MNAPLTPLVDSVKVMLRQDLPWDVIKKVNGNDYVSSHYVITRLNDVFGHDGWRDEYGAPTIREGERPLIYVTCTLHAAGTSRTDVGVGICATGKPDAFETAIKAAYTDALKRCARTFGASFGLALYDKDRLTVGISTVALGMISDIEALMSVEALTRWSATSKEAINKLDQFDRDAVMDAWETRRRNIPAQPAAAPTHTAAPGPAAAAPTQQPAPAFTPPANRSSELASFPRVAQCTDVDELAAVRFALWPPLDQAQRNDLDRALTERAKTLGADVAALKAASSAASQLSRNAMDWQSVAETLAAIREAADAASLKALVGKLGPKVTNLPKPLKDRLNKSREARLKAFASSSPSISDAMIAEAGRARNGDELKAIYERVTDEMKALRLTPEDGERVCEALNERAASFEARAA